jgi:hypothetical protein
MRHARHHYTPKEMYFRMVHLAARLAEYIDGHRPPLRPPQNIRINTGIFDFQAYILPGPLGCILVTVNRSLRFHVTLLLLASLKRCVASQSQRLELPRRELKSYWSAPYALSVIRGRYVADVATSTIYDAQLLHSYIHCLSSRTVAVLSCSRGIPIAPYLCHMPFAFGPADLVQCTS